MVYISNSMEFSDSLLRSLFDEVSMNSLYTFIGNCIRLVNDLENLKVSLKDLRVEI